MSRPVGTRVITFGTFDVFHVGHVNILTRAHDLGDRLIVGISTDELNFAKKGRYPVYRQEHRADVLVMGSDWEGRFDEFSDIVDVRYLPRTADVSTTDIIHEIRNRIID